MDCPELIPEPLIAGAVGMLPDLSQARRLTAGPAPVIESVIHASGGYEDAEAASSMR